MSPLWHCTDCHHEWEGLRSAARCDWCGEPGYVLEAVTSFERFVAEQVRDGLRKVYRKGAA